MISSSGRFLGRRQSRRFALQLAVAGGGLGAALVVGCGGSKSSTSTSSETGSTAPAGGTVAASTGNPKLDRVLKAYAPNPPEPADTPKKGGVLRIGVSFGLATFDPTKSQSASTVLPVNAVYSRLVTFQTGPQYDPQNPKIVPDLAKSWEQPDPLTFTYRLTPGVKFHNKPPLNGRELTADDVKYAYERSAKSGVNAGLLQEVASITVVDPQTVQIKLKEPFADLPYRLGGRYLPIFPKELGESDAINTQMVGTGPMMLSKVQPGQAITFERNPYYFGGQPYLDGFELALVPDFATLNGLFRAGQVGWASQVPGTGVDDANQLLDQVPGLFGIRGEPNLTNMWLMLNLENPKYKDPRVRRALAMGKNHDVVGKTAFGGYYYYGSGMPWPLFSEKPESLDEMGQWFKYNPAEAKKLLEAAGQANLEVAGIETPQTGASKRIDELTVDQYRSIGVTLKVQELDANASNSQYTSGKYPDAVAQAWRAPTVAPSDAFELLFKTGAPSNRNHFSDPEIDQLIVQQKQATDPAQAKKIRQQIRQKFLDEVWFVPHPAGIDFLGFQPWVRNMRFGHTQAPVAWFYDWGPQLAKVWLNK